jgi:hypothetical protein
MRRVRGESEGSHRLKPGLLGRWPGVRLRGREAWTGAGARVYSRRGRCVSGCWRSGQGPRRNRRRALRFGPEMDGRLKASGVLAVAKKPNKVIHR